MISVLKPGCLLQAVDTIIGTGLPNGDNVIIENSWCIFLSQENTSTTDNCIHYKILIVDADGKAIVDEFKVTSEQFKSWFRIAA